MNAFEQACNTENYTGEVSQENVIEWIRGDKEVTVTLAGNTKYCNKVKKYAEKYPDTVKIIATNQDNSIVAHLPLSWIKIAKPKEVSEEQKEQARARLAKFWESKNAETAEEQTDDEDM